jgi:hypothetical protein
MDNAIAHEIELFPPETFKTLLDHEVIRSRRYGDSLTLIDMIVEADPATPEAQHSAEVFTINALNLHLRDADIPCKKGNEFLILMPSTSAPGARTACERFKKLMTIEHQAYDRVSFAMFVFIGMATWSVDRSASSDGLLQNAAQALEYARANQITHAVSFSEIKK